MHTRNAGAAYAQPGKLQKCLPMVIYEKYLYIYELFSINMNTIYLRLLALVAFTAFMQSCSVEQIDPITASQTEARAPGTQRTTSDNLLMGNPSNAVTSTTSPTNYLMQKLQFALSYNRDLGKPNWVSWHLDPTWLGSASRTDAFASDATLPTGWYRVTSSSYTNSGFDRGHNTPSADRTLNSTDNAVTFLMTNIMPQAPINNQQTWARLETYCRTLVGQGNELYIVCGSYGVGGTGSNGYRTTLDNGRVTVPSNCWKVAIILPQGTNDISRITTTTRVIAINTPNSNSLSTSWGTYRTSVDAIEASTGYDLFSNMPDAIEANLESRIDNGPTQ